MIYMCLSEKTFAIPSVKERLGPAALDRDPGQYDPPRSAWL